MLAYKYGIKNLYYTNTFDGDTQTALHTKQEVKQETKTEEPQDDTQGCAGGACTL